MQRPKTERRRQPRVEEKIPLKIKDEGFDAISVTKNISCSGVFCQVDGYFPLLSKVKIVLLLPSEEKSKAHPVHIDGVVVRSEPVKDLGPEAIRKLSILDLPLVVMNDSRGNGMYLSEREKWRTLS